MESACRHTDSSVCNAGTISLSSNFNSIHASIQSLGAIQAGSSSSNFILFVYYVMLCCFHRYLQLRQERRKQREFVCDFENHRKAERDAIAKLHSHGVNPAAAIASKPDQIPRRRRSASGAKNAGEGHSANSQPGRSSGDMRSTGDHDAPGCKEPGFSSLSMASETTSHVKSLFKNLAMDGVEAVTCIRASEGHIGQTQVQISADILTRVHNIAVAGAGFDNSFRLQLGYSQLYVKSSASDNEKVHLLKLRDQDPVPAILHASYVAGILTIYGLQLTGAEIVAATSDKCRMLVTECQKGAGNLEIHTAFLGTLPSQNLSKLYVYATKKISVNKREVCVNSSAIPIQNETFNSVLRNIFPITIFLACAAKQSIFLIHLMQTAKQAPLSVLILVPILVIISAQFFPKSAETTVTNSWEKLCRCVYFSLICFPSLSYSTLQESHGHLSEEDSDIEGDKEEKFDDDGKPTIDDETHPNWQWPIYDTVHNPYASFSLVRRIMLPSANVKENKPLAAFEVIYYNLKDLPWACQVGVKILSPSLIKVFDELIPEKAEQWVRNRVTLPGKELFFIHQNLKDFVEPLLTDASSSADNRLLHLNHLLRFLDQELHDVEEMYESMKSKRKLSWDMLWAFFPPGETIVYPCNITNVEVCGTVLGTKYELGRQGPLFIISISKWDYNCQSWKEYTTWHVIGHFEGDRAFDNMEIHPIHFKGDPGAIKEAFLQQGSQFCKLSMLNRSNFMQYKGLMFRGREKENADGRVMIDLGSFAKMDADYNLESAQPPCEVIRDNLFDPIDICSRPSRMFSSAKVYGFSFHLKKWGCFSICGFTDIQFNDSAFDLLVLDEATKELSKCVVRERLKSQETGNNPQKSDNFDLIAAKGEGCIFLCYGPPGTGKTLTAESLAEKFQRPLWSLSVSELGTTPGSLEFMLVRVMEIAVHWGALLLLDEADVYLERRESSDLVRNAMTGVFLRQLEYYRGVLFLTTNRDFAFDEAFCSRISIFLRYENLSESQRNVIWRNILDRSEMTNIPSEEDIAEFSRYNFNGREIRNVMQTAQTVARSRTEPLDAKHITQALKVLQASIKLRACSDSEDKSK